MDAEVRLRRWTRRGGDDFEFLDGRVDSLVIEAGAPGGVFGGDGVGVPAGAPEFIGCVVADIGTAGAESILRGDAADGDMQRMIGEEQVGTPWDLLEREVLAA